MILKKQSININQVWAASKMIEVIPPLTIDEASSVSNMSKSWWRKMVFERKIKHLKIGRKVLIPYEVYKDLMKKSIVEARR